MIASVFNNTFRNLRKKPTSRLLCRTLQSRLAQPVAGIYTAEHKELQNSLLKIIDKEINPYVDQWEAEKQFPAHKVFKILGNAGFLGVTKPVEYGGMGLDYSYSIAVTEAFGNINCGGVPMAIAVQTDMATPALARFGSDALKKEFLAPTIAGDQVSCIGVSEPHAGSDVASIKTTAVRKGDDLIINGTKMWITSAVQGDWICLLVNTSKGAPHKSKSLVCVPLKSPGVQIIKRIDKMGMFSSDTAQIFFEDVKVPAANIIGEEGMGFVYQMMQFQEERMAACAGMLAPLSKCIDLTVEYTKQRTAFGQPVINNQAVHFRLAELMTEVECFRSLIFRAVELYVSGNDVTKLASMGKLKCGRLSREVTDSCLQFWGGMGFTNEVLVSRMYRDLRLMSIGGGSDEMMLGIISKYMGTLPKPSK